MVGADVILRMILEVFQNIARIIGCGLRCKICILLFIMVGFSIYYFFFRDTNKQRLYENSSHELQKVIKNNFVLLHATDGNDDNAVFDRDVDKMLVTLYKKYKNFSLRQITVNQYPATVWRISEIPKYNIKLFQNKSEKRKSLLLERSRYVKWMIENNDRARYHLIYSVSDISIVPSINTLYTNMERYKKIHISQNSTSSELAVYTFVKFDNDENYYIFIENGGTQLHRDHDPKNNQQQKYFCFIILTKDQYYNSVYRYLIEDILYDKL
jgi:hypothetical protein